MKGGRPKSSFHFLLSFYPPPYIKGLRLIRLIGSNKVQRETQHGTQDGNLEQGREREGRGGREEERKGEGIKTKYLNYHSPFKSVSKLFCIAIVSVTYAAACCRSCREKTGSAKKFTCVWLLPNDVDSCIALCHVATVVLNSV
jgi:hypothetical protein